MPRLHFENLHNAKTSIRLPAGPYALCIDAVDPNYVAGTGSEGLEIKAHVIQGMDFDDGSSTIGVNRTIRLFYPTDKQKDGGKFCLGQLNELGQACGAVDPDTDELDTDALPGATFAVDFEITKDKNGRESENWKNFREFN